MFLNIFNVSRCSSKHAGLEFRRLAFGMAASTTNWLCDLGHLPWTLGYVSQLLSEMKIKSSGASCSLIL